MRVLVCVPVDVTALDIVGVVVPVTVEVLEFVDAGVPVGACVAAADVVGLGVMLTVLEIEAVAAAVELVESVTAAVTLALGGTNSVMDATLTVAIDGFTAPTANIPICRIPAAPFRARAYDAFSPAARVTLAASVGGDDVESATFTTIAADAPLPPTQYAKADALSITPT